MAQAQLTSFDICPRCAHQVRATGLATGRRLYVRPDDDHIWWCPLCCNWFTQPAPRVILDGLFVPSRVIPQAYGSTVQHYFYAQDGALWDYPAAAWPD
jgi:hypothetical protein